MDLLLIECIKSEVEAGRKVAHLVITEKEGAAPRGEGTAMVVKENGDILGTIGGGKIEFEAIEEAKRAMVKNESKSLEYGVNVSSESAGEFCGGKVKVFLKVYKPEEKIVIAGAGHVGYNLYCFAEKLGYDVVMLDDREGFLTEERYPNAVALHRGDIIDNLKKINLDKNTYVMVSSSSHISDENILYEVLKNDPKYIGMLGSKKKVSTIFKSLIKRGVSDEKLSKVNSPVGIGLGGSTPEDVAFSIMAEIHVIKNEGKLKHMKKDVSEII